MGCVSPTLCSVFIAQFIESTSLAEVGVDFSGEVLDCARSSVLSCFHWYRVCGYSMYKMSHLGRAFTKHYKIAKLDRPKVR